MTADLTHVDTWIFDLDNTLYPAECGLMRQIEGRMTAFVAELTGLPHDEAYALQKRYLHQHGLTVRGLMIEHGVELDAFNAQFHDISLECLASDPDLVAAIARLPGRRLIFTNADAVHARRVLERLELSGLFDEVFHIDSFGFTPKPERAGFERMAAEHGVAPARAAFFEDSERNLAPAADLGMTTVLVGAHALTSTAPFVHHRTPALVPFLAAARLRDPKHA